MESTVVEEVKQPYDIKEAHEFLDSLRSDNLEFLTYFLGKQVCFRCVLMLFNEPNLQLYRI